MNTPLLNDMIVTEDLYAAFQGLEENVAIACDTKAKEICVELFPSIDFTRQENIDLVIRPLSAVIAVNELALQNLFSESTLEGIVSSNTIPSSTKAMMLKNFASLNGIRTASNDPESLYNEISFYIHNNNINRKDVLSNSILEEFPSIDRLSFIDNSFSEMVRSKIPYVQINHLKVMDFERSEHNIGTLVGTAYSRADYQTYQDYKKSDNVVIPGMLDVYFSTPIVTEELTLTKEMGYYNIDGGYFIDIQCDKGFVILEQDIFSEGIVKTNIVLFIPEGEEEETVSVTRYQDPVFESYSKNDEFTIVDILTKGFFPLFIDFEIFTRDSVDTDAIRLGIGAYFDTIGGSIASASINDLQNFLKARGTKVTFSPKSMARLFTSAGKKIDMDVIFPLSMKDIQIPPELEEDQYSGKTIKLFVGDINVTKE